MNCEQSDGAAGVGGCLFAGVARLHQAPTGHRVGTDAVLLAAAAPADLQGLVLDAGAGVGAVGIVVGLRAPLATLELVDVDSRACEMAIENLALNGLSGRARVVEADLLSARARRAAGLVDGRAQLVTLNPPYYAPGKVRASPDPEKARAHVLGAEEGAGLDAWIRMAAASTAPDGVLALVHRSDNLSEILSACEGRFGDVRIVPIYPKEGLAATRIVLRGRKGSRAPTSLRPALVLHRGDGAFTDLAAAIHRGSAMLPME
jgi:tRNA1(Val) A37 N6-methylase TrmN6